MPISVAHRHVHSPTGRACDGPAPKIAPGGACGRDVQMRALAWDVVDAARGNFTASELTMVFVSLGVGEYESVIETVLERLARDRHRLPGHLTGPLKTWVDMYQGWPPSWHAWRSPEPGGGLYRLST